jgi:hypothetical protein
MADNKLSARLRLLAQRLEQGEEAKVSSPELDELDTQTEEVISVAVAKAAATLEDVEVQAVSVS